MEQEMIVLADEGGNEYKMNIIERFEHDGEIFVVMLEMHDCDCGCDSCGGCHDEEEHSAVYVMKEETDAEGNKTYSQVEEEKIDAVAQLVRQIFGLDDECGCDCGCDECEDDECHCH